MRTFYGLAAGAIALLPSLTLWAQPHEPVTLAVLAIATPSALREHTPTLSPSQRDATQQLQDALLAAIDVNPSSQSELSSANRAVLRSIGCIRKQYAPADAARTVHDVERETLDSPQRIEAYNAYVKALTDALAKPGSHFVDDRAKDESFKAYIEMLSNVLKPRDQSPCGRERPLEPSSRDTP
jgi:hypothetical protein